MEEEIIPVFAQLFKQAPDNTVQLVLIGMFMIAVGVFTATFVLSAYHLRRYSVKRSLPIKAESIYVLVSLAPLAVMFVILFLV